MKLRPFLIILAIAMAAQPLRAEERGDAARGLALAREVCSECHAIQRNSFSRRRCGRRHSWRGDDARQGAGRLAVPRGLVEFRADPASAMHDKAFDRAKTVVAYCASGGRSALVGKTLKDMGMPRC